jgi:serine protease AprX
MRKNTVLCCLVAILCTGIFSSLVSALNVSAPAINANSVWSQGITGSGVRVAVLDSGIDNFSRPALSGKVVFAVDFTTDSTVNDLFGHGTHVAGIIASTNNTYRGVAYGCDLINVKIINRFGGWSLARYSNGIQWCIDNKNASGIGVINLSAGELRVNRTSGQKSPCDGTCDFCRKSEEAIEAGIVFVAAAGNEGAWGSQTLRCPAYSFNVITVGASNHNGTVGINDDTLAGYSSRGPTRDNRSKPDVLAPGSERNASPGGIWSCTSSQAPLSFYETNTSDGLWGRLSGTSMAAPHVSGTVALMLQANKMYYGSTNIMPAQVKAILRQTARLNNNLSSLTKNERGYGIIDANQSVYVARAIILINGSLTFDEYHVDSNSTLDGGVYRQVKFDVNRTSYGIDLKNMMLNETGSSPYKIFESIKTPYVWIDGSAKYLGAYSYFLLCGPRVSDKGPGSVTIRATYKIGDVTVQLNYYVSVYMVQPFVLLSSSGSHSYSKLIYLDAALRGQSLDFATYSNGTTINNEIKIYNKEVRVKDNPSAPTWPYLQCTPNLGTPYTWILRNDGIIYDNPDNGISNPPESVYGQDIVLYYKYESAYPGPMIYIKYS